MKTLTRSIQTAVVLTLFCLTIALCQAQTLYHVTINTAALKGKGLHHIAFQLLDGSLDGNGNATSVITNFTLNGGTLGTTLPSLGNVSGILQDTLTLRDGPAASGFLADFAREFTVTSANSEIHFDLQLSAAQVESLFEDSFTMQILDASLTALATTGPFGVEIVGADFTTTTPTPVGYSTQEAPLLTAVVTQPTNSLSSVTLNMFQTSSTLPVTGTVKLNTPAPAGGTVVTLSSNRPGVASAPATVTVPGGAKSVTFPVQTYGTAGDTDVTFTAQLGSIARTVTLTVQPLLQSFSLSASAACGTQSLVATVLLSRANPSQTTMIQLSSGHTRVALPANVSIPANQVSLTFPVTIGEIETASDVCLYASVAGATVSATLTLLPDPMYTFTDLGTLDGLNSVATGINGTGQVAGMSETVPGETHAFLYSSGMMTDLNTLGGLQSTAHAINATGSVVGDSQTSLGETHAFLYTFSVLSDLETLGGLHSSARAINNNGQSAGEAQTELGDTHAFLRRFDSLLDLGTLGGQNSRALGLTDGGQVIGVAQTQNSKSHAFQWQNGIMTDLGTLGGDSSVASAISALGLIVGSSATASSNIHAFLYRNGTMSDLGTPGGLNSYAYAVNRYGQVVGRGQTASGDDVAFLACEGVLHDLNTRVLDADMWSLIAATGINDKGQIVGRAYNGTDSHAFLLTPLPAAQPLPVISGVITLEDCAQQSQSLTATFYSGIGQPLFKHTLSLNPDGSFFLRGVPSGTYRLAIRGEKWLQRVVDVDTTGGDVTGVSILLQGGDANQDNSVDVFDLDLLVQAFDSMDGVSNWNPTADFNCDLFVDVFDLDLLIRNFDLIGDEL